MCMWAIGTCFTPKMFVGGPGWKEITIPFHPGPLTDDVEVKQVPFAHIYILPPDDGLQMSPKQYKCGNSIQ
jgi:hypothetical protein